MDHSLLSGATETDNVNLFAFLNELRRGRIYYRLSQHRDNAIMVEVTVPGERWEVEFLDGGEVDVEIFDASILGAMVAKHSDSAIG